jgi:hypothetical protein
MASSLSHRFYRLSKWGSERERSLTEATQQIRNRARAKTSLALLVQCSHPRSLLVRNNRKPNLFYYKEVSFTHLIRSQGKWLQASFKTLMTSRLCLPSFLSTFSS